MITILNYGSYYGNQNNVSVPHAQCYGNHINPCQFIYAHSSCNHTILCPVTYMYVQSHSDYTYLCQIILVLP